VILCATLFVAHQPRDNNPLDGDGFHVAVRLDDDHNPRQGLISTRNPFLASSASHNNGSIWIIRELVFDEIENFPLASASFSSLRLWLPFQMITYSRDLGIYGQILLSISRIDWLNEDCKSPPGDNPSSSCESKGFFGCEICDKQNFA
jgi:hypothetical protein